MDHKSNRWTREIITTKYPKFENSGEKGVVVEMDDNGVLLFLLLLFLFCLSSPLGASADVTSICALKA